MRLRLVALCGAVAVSLAGGSAQAAGWIVTVGGRLSASPPYEGADHDVIGPAPVFSLRRADSPDRFEPPDGGSTLALFSTRYIAAGPMARIRYARGDSGKLTGMDKIKIAIEPGAFVNLWPTNWLRLRAEGRRGFIGHHGWVGDAGADLIYTGSRWSASVGPRVGYGDHRYMDTYFGVTPVEAARSPLLTTAYDPSGNLRYLGAEAAISYRLTGGLRTHFDVGYHRMSENVARSPIVQVAGSRDQIFAGVGLTYRFGG